MSSLYAAAVIAAALFGAVPAVHAVRADSPPTVSIRFAPEKAYAPFVFDADNGEPAGLSIDLLRAVQPSLGVRIEWLPSAPLAEILQGARQGQVDLISSLRPTSERAGFLTFTSPYIKVPAVLVTRSDMAAPDLQALRGRLVGVGQGYAVEAAMRERYPSVRWVALPDDWQALQALRSGELDAVVADVGSVRHLLKSNGLAGVRVGDSVGFEYPLSFAVRKQHSEFGIRLEKALREMDPLKRREIVQKWLPEDMARHSSAAQQAWQWWAIGALALAGCGGLITLHRQRRVGAAP